MSRVVVDKVKKSIWAGVITFIFIGAGLAFLAKPASAANTQWYLYTPGTETVSYVDFMDTNACGANNDDSIDAYTYTGNVNSGNNLCVNFTANIPSASSTADQVFEYQSSTSVTMSPYTISLTSDNQIQTTSGTSGGIRIAIATSSVDMRWDPTVTGATCSGTAVTNNKISASCTASGFEGDNSVAVIPVTNNFVVGDWVRISGLKFKDFNQAVAPASQRLRLYTGGQSDITAVGGELDTKQIGIKGILTSDTADVQQSNKFATDPSSISSSPVFSFKLSPGGGGSLGGQGGEDVTITQLKITLSGVRGIISSDITNATIYRDFNANGIIDASETSYTVGGTGAVSISGSSGTITFEDDFSATTTQNYILTADITGIGPEDEISFSFVPSASTISTLGGTSNQTNLGVSGSSNRSYHINIFGRGGGGGILPIGVSANISVATTTGGTFVTPGEEIGGEPGFLAPTASNFSKNQWTDDSYAFTSDEQRAYSSTYNNLEDYGNFNFSIPSGVIIDGIEVKLEASAAPAGGNIGVELGYDSGNATTTTGTTTPALTTSDTIYEMGGPTYTWGRSWAIDDFSNANFRVRVQSKTSGGNTIYIDAIQAKVYYHTTGGGGGGGECVDCLIYAPPERKNFLANLYEAFKGLMELLGRVI